MNNQRERIDPETGSAIFHHIATDSHVLDTPMREPSRAGGAVAAVHDDPKRGMVVNWLPQSAGSPTRQESAGPASDPIKLISNLEEVAPHAIALLCRVWGKPEAARVFRTLFLGADGRVRRWPRDAWEELVLVRNLHQSLYPCPESAAATTSGAAAMPDLASVPELEIGFRHVVDRLLKCWGNVEAFAVVHHDLIFDGRGDRAGWPAEVWGDLVLLQEIHDQAHGKLPAGAEPWKSFFLNP